MRDRAIENIHKKKQGTWDDDNNYTTLPFSGVCTYIHTVQTEGNQIFLLLFSIPFYTRLFYSILFIYT